MQSLYQNVERKKKSLQIAIAKHVLGAQLQRASPNILLNEIS